ncbi:hypothetical protein EDD16DRAFT_1525926 [Pisolithus croceorrhizus]|nr:hypothetical protein EDD16DRAFT_1525926 [Pisolithus croceorrhizus]KAI6122441.1 hypothetical protein EV401DRAFT_1887247 [Pisolithus croceorrhizus]
MVPLAKLPPPQKPAKVGSSCLFYGVSGNDVTVLISLCEAFPTEWNTHQEPARKAIDGDVESAKVLGEVAFEPCQTELAPEQLNFMATVASAEWNRCVIYATVLNALSLRLGTNIYSLCEVIVTNVFRRDVGTGGGSSTVQTCWNRDGAVPSGEDDVLLLSGTFSTAPIPRPLSATQCDRFRWPAATASTFPVSHIQYLVFGGIFNFRFFGGHKCRYGLAYAAAIRKVGIPLEVNSGFILTPTITYLSLHIHFYIPWSSVAIVLWNSIDIYHAFRDFATIPVSLSTHRVRRFIENSFSLHTVIIDAIIGLAMNGTNVVCVCTLFVFTPGDAHVTSEYTLEIIEHVRIENVLRMVLQYVMSLAAALRIACTATWDCNVPQPSKTTVARVTVRFQCRGSVVGSLAPGTENGNTNITGEEENRVNLLKVQGAIQTAFWVRSGRSPRGARSRRILLNTGNDIRSALFRRLGLDGGWEGNTAFTFVGVQAVGH